MLTGETGAGKSILVDALQLLAGGRAGAEVVRHGAERAEVSGTFDLSRAPRELKQWLEEQSMSIQRRAAGAARGGQRRALARLPQRAVGRRCSCCARPATSSSTSTASTNFSP